MNQLLLHAGAEELGHALVDAAVSVGVGVVLVAVYLAVLRYYVGSGGRGTR